MIFLHKAFEVGPVFIEVLNHFFIAGRVSKISGLPFITVIYPANQLREESFFFTRPFFNCWWAHSLLQYFLPSNLFQLSVDGLTSGFPQYSQYFFTTYLPYGLTSRVYTAPMNKYVLISAPHLLASSPWLTPSVALLPMGSTLNRCNSFC